MLQLLTLLAALTALLSAANAELSTQFGYAPDSVMYSEYGQVNAQFKSKPLRCQFEFFFCFNQLTLNPTPPTST